MRSRTLVMGVLNVTPDSFSDGGLFDEPDAAVQRGSALAAQGADLIDIGGESTRPGANPVAPEEELRRVLPVIRGLTARGHRISVDTLHAATAAEAVAAGARFINDVSGGSHDSDMLRVAATASQEYGARFIIGHWRGVPDPAHQRSDYGDVVAEVRDDLASRTGVAIAAGIARELIVLDPGLGFDKTGAQGWQLLAHLDALTSLGFPVLIGASRKRMIAEALTTPLSAAPPPEGRDVATAVVSALAAGQGAWGVRVHDVPATVQALAISEAWRSGQRTTTAIGTQS
ncbi:dihydropteroate synthase [Leucobacter coleopterorum]|nr:dihydropteroate synthase [Leucobacter coleopterorum]